MSAIIGPRDMDHIFQNDLMSFTERVFYELFPQSAFSMAPHLELMAAKLSACLAGRGPKRLIINLPPRSLKSIMVSVASVAWLLGRHPNKQIICASYGQDLADKHARDTRTLMTSAFYQRLFPVTRLSQSKLSVNDFMTTQQGFRMATSVGGVLTGRGADLIIIDDPLKPEDALSDSRRSANREAGSIWITNSVSLFARFRIRSEWRSDRDRSHDTHVPPRARLSVRAFRAGTVKRIQFAAFYGPFEL